MSDPTQDKILDALKARMNLVSPADSAGVRTETPEPGAREGHRSSVQLLDDEGQINDLLYNALSHIFAKYCTPICPPSLQTSTPQGSLVPPPPSTSFLSEAGLDAFARDTNGGKPFDADTKSEIKEFFDLDEETGGLTLKGFEQMYQLQTEADEEETWKDLAAHGFDRSLKLVSSRREDEIEEAAPVAMEELSGLGMGGTKRDEEMS